ncbi:MAG: glycosyltransferase family 2 protein [Desulfomicrobium apsheronum]|nr:glycosyltransferase family 2 protein [Desulfomicrobium apsheronum]
MGQYKVAIIIPVFNQWALTADCLRSLREHTPDEDVQVIVVDNGSTDETAGACGVLGQELFGERFEHLRLDENINFGPGCNLGASRADADFLFFLNNDTLLTPGWLPPLLRAFEVRPELGAVGPLLLYPDQDRVQHLGVTFTPTNHVTHLYHNFPSTHPAVQRERNLQAITGAALMIPAGVFGQAGRFWEEYRNGYEDLDLCWKIRSLGLTLRCEPESRVYHLTSQTPGRFNAESHNSQVLARRCHGAFYPDMHLFAHADGYELRLTSTLTANIVCVRSEGETKDFGMERLWAEVIAEPLWEAGYERLLDFFFKQGMWDAALDVLQLQQSYFSTEKVVTGLARVASRLGDAELLTNCRNTFEQLREEAASKDIPRKFMALQHWAVKTRDEVLLDVCRRWSAHHQARDV